MNNFQLLRYNKTLLQSCMGQIDSMGRMTTHYVVLTELYVLTSFLYFPCIHTKVWEQG